MSASTDDGGPNRIAVLMAKMQTCIRCGMMVPPDASSVSGRCDDCDYEDRRANDDAKEDLNYE